MWFVAFKSLQPTQINASRLQARGPWPARTAANARVVLIFCKLSAELPETARTPKKSRRGSRGAISPLPPCPDLA